MKPGDTDPSVAARLSHWAYIQRLGAASEAVRVYFEDISLNLRVRAEEMTRGGSLRWCDPMTAGF